MEKFTQNFNLSGLAKLLLIIIFIMPWISKFSWDKSGMFIWLGINIPYIQYVLWTWELLIVLFAILSFFGFNTSKFAWILWLIVSASIIYAHTIWWFGYNFMFAQWIIAFVSSIYLITR